MVSVIVKIKNLHKNRGVSTFIAVLILITLAIAAGVVIYAYTMGYIGGVNVQIKEGVLHVQSAAEFDEGLHLYIMNIGNEVAKIDPSGQARLYVNDQVWNYTTNMNIVLEGSTCEVILTDLNEFIGSTINIKLVTEGGGFVSYSYKVNKMMGNCSLTVSAGVGGTIIKNPDQIKYLPGTIVKLTASYVNGYKFDHWEGDITGTSNPVQITMDSSKNVIAIFSEVIFSDGFESGDTIAWTGAVNNWSIVEDVSRLGAYSLKGVGNSFAYVSGLDYEDSYFRGYFRINELPSDAAWIISIYDAGWSGLNAGIFRDGSNYRWFMINDGTPYYSSIVTVDLDYWYCIEIRRKVGDGVGIASLWINGVEVLNQTSLTITNNNSVFCLGNVYWGADSTSETIVDCAIIDSSYIGP